MPIADIQTPTRSANDIDMLDEACWTYLEQCGWTATPQLFFAVKDVMRQEQYKAEFIHWVDHIPGPTFTRDDE